MSIPRRIKIGANPNAVLVMAIPIPMAAASRRAMPGRLFERQKNTMSATAGQGTIPVIKANHRSSFQDAFATPSPSFVEDLRNSRREMMMSRMPVRIGYL